jgi:hypothetical protein
VNDFVNEDSICDFLLFFYRQSQAFLDFGHGGQQRKFRSGQLYFR